MDAGDLDLPFNLDTWKGSKGKIKPCFGAIKLGRDAIKSDRMYNALTDARSDGNKQLVESIMRDAVDILNHALTGGPVDEVAVTVANTAELPADF